MDYLQQIKYFEKYLQEELSAEEVAEFNHRLVSDKAFSRSYEAFKNDLLKESDCESPAFYSKTEAWRHVQEHLYRPNPPSTAITGKKAFSSIKAATLLVLVLVIATSLSYLLLNKKAVSEVEMVTKVTERGQKSTITFSDGSTVRLNSGSTLIYPRAFGSESRTVHLTGEAFFDVARDPKRPFIVQSADIQTRVLGTSFNIHAFPDDGLHEIAVRSGTVSLTFGDNPSTEIRLVKGEQLHYAPSLQEWTKSDIDPENVGVWTKGYLYFDNEPIENVLKTLSRWYGIDIEVEGGGVSDCRITLKQQNESLTNILEILKYTTGINYEFKENKVVINGGSC